MFLENKNAIENQNKIYDNSDLKLIINSHIKHNIDDYCNEKHNKFIKLNPYSLLYRYNKDLNKDYHRDVSKEVKDTKGEFMLKKDVLLNNLLGKNKKNKKNSDRFFDKFKKIKFNIVNKSNNRNEIQNSNLKLLPKEKTSETNKENEKYFNINSINTRNEKLNINNFLHIKNFSLTGDKFFKKDKNIKEEIEIFNHRYRTPLTNNRIVLSRQNKNKENKYSNFNLNSFSQTNLNFKQTFRKIKGFQTFKDEFIKTSVSNTHLIKNQSTDKLPLLVIQKINPKTRIKFTNCLVKNSVDTYMNTDYQVDNLSAMNI